MVQEKIREMIKPIIQEVYKEGYRDGERRILKAYEYGWNVGHADTMAALGALDIEELNEKYDTDVFDEIEELKGTERVKRSEVTA